MGKKGSWFSAVKKVFSPDSKKDKKKQKSHRSKKASSDKDGEAAVTLPPIEDVKLIEAEKEQSKHAVSLAFATAVAAEAAVAAAQAAAEVVRLTSLPHYHGKTKEEIATIKIQTAFRGYMARRALRALRGLVRLKTLVQGQSVKRQATSTLRSMQTLARLQSQIRERRIRMSEENQALQRQLQQKHEKELEKLCAAVGEEWDDSLQSKEQIEAKLLHKQEAALRRERALAYSFSHQQTWKGSSKSLNPTFMDPNNPQWGWSWLERWMTTRPWDGHSTVDHNDHASVKSAARRAMSVGEISKLYSLQDQNHNTRPSPFGQKARRPSSHISPSKAPSASGKARPSSSKGSSVWGGDDESRSMLSVQSERYRRHSIAGSSVRDDESLASSPAIPSYMAPTSSAKARFKIHRPSPEKGGAAVSAKKRLFFSPSPAPSRRYSDPPKVEMLSNKDYAPATVSNGRGSFKVYRDVIRGGALLKGGPM
ncbi:Protein IQ-DOMAIN 1, partial [Mucuna pruriens]